MTKNGNTEPKVMLQCTTLLGRSAAFQPSLGKLPLFLYRHDVTLRSDFSCGAAGKQQATAITQGRVLEVADIRVDSNVECSNPKQVCAALPQYSFLFAFSGGCMEAEDPSQSCMRFSLFMSKSADALGPLSWRRRR